MSAEQLEWFVCPYNKAHVMKQNRAHSHVINCRKANMHRNFKICSFNALHHYPAEKECQHMAECKNRIAFVDSKCLGIYTDSHLVGNLALPPAVQVEFEGETWDSE